MGGWNTRYDSCTCNQCKKSIGEEKSQEFIEFNSKVFCSEDCLLDFIFDNELATQGMVISGDDQRSMAEDFAIDCARGK